MTRPGWLPCLWRFFFDAHNKPPRWIVLDLDATDDPIHGQQEAGYFHGYYDCHCYLPLYIFCNRFLLAAKLRPSNLGGADGAVGEVARVVGQVRARCVNGGGNMYRRGGAKMYHGLGGSLSA